MKKIILVGVLLIIVILATGLVYFLINKPFQETQEKIFAMSPKEVYLALKTEAATAEDLDGMISIYKKYLSDEFFQENNTKLQTVPIDQKVEVFNTLKSLVVPLKDINTDTILENVTGDSAVIIAYTKKNTSVGIISSIKENGIWKVSGPEDWIDNKSR